MVHLEEYRNHPDPEKRERASNWRIAIGLQAVDSLTTSNYLIETARKHIEGEITIDKAQELIKEYYRLKKSSKEAVGSKK